MNWTVCNMHGPWYPPTFYRLVGNILMWKSYNSDWSAQIVDPASIIKSMRDNPNARPC